MSKNEEFWRRKLCNTYPNTHFFLYSHILLSSFKNSLLLLTSTITFIHMLPASFLLVFAPPYSPPVSPPSLCSINLTYLTGYNLSDITLPIRFHSWSYLYNVLELYSKHLRTSLFDCLVVSIVSLDLSLSLFLHDLFDDT